MAVLNESIGMGYPPDIIFPFLGSSIPRRSYSFRGVIGMTLKTHQNGIPIDIWKLGVWQRKNLFAKMCDGKKQYFSEKSALIAMNMVKDHCLPMGGPLSVYICPFCGWWHFGHIPWDVQSTEGDE